MKGGSLYRSRAVALTLEVMDSAKRIEVRPDVMLGKPVIRGTRISVQLILRRIREGASEADLLLSYPHLTREDIRAAVAYATDHRAGEHYEAGER